MLRGIFPLTAGLVLAGGLSQFPEFAQQYTQRVGGAWVEVRTVADGFRADAASSGRTVDEALDLYRSLGSTFYNDRAASMETLLDREAFLRTHYARLTQGTGFDQLVVFAKERDVEIARDTLSIYKPALPFSFTGIAHAALGFLAGFLILSLPFSIRRRRPA
jgi:hypothetical protein